VREITHKKKTNGTQGIKREEERWGIFKGISQRGEETEKESGTLVYRK